VRLDHLLSKEHHPPVGGMGPAPPGGGGGVLECGGDAGGVGGRLWPGSSSTTIPVGVVGNGGRGVVGAGGEASCWVLREQPVGLSCQCQACSGLADRSVLGRLWSSRVRVGGVGWWGVGWSLVEMCIVDASIFVVKLSRADGGCLGTRSR